MKNLNEASGRDAELLDFIKELKTSLDQFFNEGDPDPLEEIKSIVQSHQLEDNVTMRKLIELIPQLEHFAVLVKTLGLIKEANGLKAEYDKHMNSTESK